MGNCLQHESSMTWGGEDWGSPADDDHRNEYGEITEKGILEFEEKRLLRHIIDQDQDQDHQKSIVTTTISTSSGDNSSSTSTTEVKIKITKRQLEDLLGKVDVRDLSVKQVLAQLINVSNVCQSQNQSQTHQLRPWKPALKSIPEVN